jgi:hypothetical protein
VKYFFSSCPPLTKNALRGVPTYPHSLVSPHSSPSLPHLQCVILTDCDLELQKTVNRFCHSHTPPIMFISCSVRGVFSSLFCDCGPEFTVVDPTGEEPAQSFIASISQANPGVVSCQEGQLHGLETGDHVEFREVVGMETLNGKTFPVEGFCTIYYTHYI